MSASLVGSEMCIRDRRVACRGLFHVLSLPFRPSQRQRQRPEAEAKAEAEASAHARNHEHILPHTH
eukprot:13547424-Alexandrium_andersonii.AAC.1